MSGLIVPGVCRFTVNGTYSDKAVANVLDMHINVVGIGATRGPAIEDQAHVIVSAWVDHVIGNLTDRYRALNVAWVDMNSDDGTTGEVSDGTGSDMPHFGGMTNNGMPANCAYLIHKQLVAGRGSRAGRMYLPGIAESLTDHDSPNVISAGQVSDINTGMAAFLSAINQTSGGSGSYDSELVVVHTKNTAAEGEAPVIEYVGRSHVDALVCDSKVSTQRRRLR